MSVVALRPYDFPAQDTRDRFPAPLLYVGWDSHLMFCAPFCVALPEDMLFAALTATVLPGIFGEHPDFARIAWDDVQWFKAGLPWTPDPAKSLRDNGLRHKDAIRFRTPGLNGIQGSHS